MRTLVESMSGRPTLGCPGNPRDTPIHQRVNSEQVQAILIHDERAIGYKSHKLHQIRAHSKSADGQWGLVFLTRDPVQAIASQFARLKRQQTLVRWPRHYLRLRNDARKFHDLVSYYVDYQDGPRLHLKFERLMDPETRHSEVVRLADAMGLNAPPEEALDHLFGLGKSALQSRANPNRSVHRLHERLVPRHVAYSKVLARIAAADASRAKPTG